MSSRSAWLARTLPSLAISTPRRLSERTATVTRYPIRIVAERIVIDASVALARLREEQGSAAVRRALRTWTQEDVQLFVPSLFWIELLNVLVRRHGWGAAAVAEGMLGLDG